MMMISSYFSLLNTSGVVHLIRILTASESEMAGPLE